MPAITITSGVFSNGREIAARLSLDHGYRIVTDAELMERVSKRYGVKPDTLQKAVHGKPIPFNNFTHEKEKCLAYLKSVIASSMAEDKCLFLGALGHLIPGNLSHVLKVLVITDKETRMENALKLHGLAEMEAAERIRAEDQALFQWAGSLFGKGAWDPSLYDMVIPSDKMDNDAAISLIEESQAKVSVDGYREAAAIADYLLAADVEAALAENGGGLIVSAENGNIEITIDKNVLLLSKFREKIVKIASGVKGVKFVETKIGRNFYRADIIRNLEFELSSDVLLVDDEKEFVHTLSERLKMRDVGTHVVYGGKEALEYADREETDVMVLDLRMPGVDGFEVLRTIKRTKPAIEVIILTGHGSEEDRKLCMELGAFAYLKKPADIDRLTRTMKEAYEKVNRNKQAQTPQSA